MATQQRICIIDDDPFLLDMYNIKFQEAGYHVDCYTDSTEGLTALRGEESYDAVLLDLIMPKLDGFGVMKAIREENLCGAQTVVVVLSNQGQDKDINQAEHYGIDGYLIKAKTLPSEVLENVQKLINEKKAAT
jgi:CheY-like chemotaxis protein